MRLAKTVIKNSDEPWAQLRHAWPAGKGLRVETLAQAAQGWLKPKALPKFPNHQPHEQCRNRSTACSSSESLGAAGQRLQGLRLSGNGKDGRGACHGDLRLRLRSPSAGTAA